ncbi:MAG: insulinase family protein [Lentimicrobiaceae bacterium]|nr:insulinase family protein [Lentimicrobiaceae bacterium]
MKKYLLSLLMVLAFGLNSFAQMAMPLPMDPNVRYGKLDNGMTYYIRHNEKPDNRADFYIAQKVGSVLEEESQRGLAHFLEHMAFNGTTNLPGMTLRNYLQSRGIKFGENLNAGTGIDQTIYMVTNVPTDLPGLVDTCLLILHDWSSFIALEEEEIDNERGVILEEERTTGGANRRVMEQLLPKMYPGSPYGERLPIGTREVIANFKYQDIRDYYHKWYRPDLQGLIIVGDVDVDAIEARIKEMFADIPAPVNPAERTQFMIEDNEEPIVAIASDPELTSYQIMMFHKQDVTPDSLKNDINYWLSQYVINIVTRMQNNRLQELTQKPNPPFVYGYSYYDDYYIAPTKEAWTNGVIAKDLQGIEEAISAMVAETKRMQQYGFTASEYERAKADFMKHIESAYNERNNTENEKYVDACLNHFISNEPLMDIETEYQLYQQIMPSLPIEAINAIVKELIPENNFVMTLQAPQREGEVLPTEEELLAMYNKAMTIEVEPYVEEVFEGPIVAELPVPGTVKKEKTDKVLGTTEWTLSNGMKVIYKQTTFKDDEIRMSAYSQGGLTALPQDDPYTLQVLGDIITLGGVGEFSAIDLPKVLAGKKVNVSPYISTYSEGMSGSCSPKDLETMMQLVYLYFTAPRADEEAFTSEMQRTKAMLKNMELNPMITLSDSLNKVMYNDHPLVKRMTAEDYDKVDYAKAMEMYKDRFADPNNFTFIFVGNIDVETFKPLVEQYLASLNKNKRKDNWKNVGIEITEEDYVTHYQKEMKDAKTSVYMIYNGDMKYNLKNQVYMSVLSDVLDIVYTKTIREEQGGTYGVGVMGTVNNRPNDNFKFLIAFDTNDEVYATLMDIAKAGLRDMAENGPRQEDLSKVLENKLKKRTEQLQENAFWTNAIISNEADDIDILTEYEEIINGITVESLADFTKQILKGNLKEVVQLPAK